jgi:hypothetical protein
MKKETLAEAIIEAERFKLKAKRLLDEAESNKDASSWSNKHTAACKRASMDLTRILADLRMGR